MAMSGRVVESDWRTRRAASESEHAVRVASECRRYRSHRHRHRRHRPPRRRRRRRPRSRTGLKRDRGPSSSSFSRLSETRLSLARSLARSLAAGVQCVARRHYESARFRFAFAPRSHRIRTAASAEQKAATGEFFISEQQQQPPPPFVSEQPLSRERRDSRLLVRAAAHSLGPFLPSFSNL